MRNSIKDHRENRGQHGGKDREKKGSSLRQTSTRKSERETGGVREREKGGKESKAEGIRLWMDKGCVG